MTLLFRGTFNFFELHSWIFFFLILFKDCDLVDVICSWFCRQPAFESSTIKLSQIIPDRLLELDNALNDKRFRYVLSNVRGAPKLGKFGVLWNSLTLVMLLNVNVNWYFLMEPSWMSHAVELSSFLWWNARWQDTTERVDTHSSRL